MSGLYEKIADLGGLLCGWERVEENAGGAGYDRVSVEDFGVRLDKSCWCWPTNRSAACTDLCLCCSTLAAGASCKVTVRDRGGPEQDFHTL